MFLIFVVVVIGFRCGTTVIGLYGSLHQLRRMAIYDEFCEKDQICMFATDIAARGLGWLFLRLNSLVAKGLRTSLSEVMVC